MRKVFLDIGAHIGETINVVLNSKYNFDIIYSFEPVRKNCDIIKNKFSDKRLILNNFGLLNKTCDKLIYCAGALGGSIFEDKIQHDIDKYPNSELCHFIRTSDWFSDNVNESDYNIIKINVEGAEINILNNLIESGEYKKIDHLLIAFDIIKIKNKKYLKDKMIKKLNDKKINFTLTSELKIAGHTHNKKINYWLNNIFKKEIK